MRTRQGLVSSSIRSLASNDDGAAARWRSHCAGSARGCSSLPDACSSSQAVVSSAGSGAPACPRQQEWRSCPRIVGSGRTGRAAVFRWRSAPITEVGDHHRRAHGHERLVAEIPVLAAAGAVWVASLTYGRLTRIDLFRE